MELREREGRKQGEGRERPRKGGEKEVGEEGGAVQARVVWLSEAREEEKVAQGGHQWGPGCPSAPLDPFYFSSNSSEN